MALANICWRRRRGILARVGVGAMALAAAGGLAGSAHAQVSIRAQEVASGLVQPVGVFSIPGDTGRLFIMEQGGIIRILNLTVDPPVQLPTPFLDLSATGLNLTAASGERGLLGLAFDPAYTTNGRYYVFYTALTGTTTRIERFTAAGAPFASQAAAFAANTSNNASRLTMLSFADEFSNHNGGALLFGTDGMLYAGVGDGGSANDPNERAQNLASLLGKVLRLDVNDSSAADGDGLYVPNDNPFRSSGTPADKVWAYGLRNPWRMSIDRLTGDLWIGDVGQDAQEEIDFQPAITPQNFSTVAGRNYGWDCREGTIAVPGGDVGPNADFGCNSNTPPNNPPGPVPYVEPVKVYLHSGGACSVTGGHVYRGSAMPPLQGAYFHADYCGNFVRSFRYNGTTVSDERVWTGQLNGVLSPAPIQGLASLGEDAAGELYLVSINLGRVYKIVSVPGTCGCPCVVQPGRPLEFSDNFQTNTGWTTASSPGTTDGFWERGVPVNDPTWAYGPVTDSDGSGSAFVTRNVAGNSDVDGGFVTLTSPALDFSDGGITICFDYHLALTQAGGGANPDGLFVEVSSNGTAGPWTRIASFTTSNDQVWTAHAIEQAALTSAGVANTANMHVRFIAADNASPAQSIVEAGVDNFKIYTTPAITDCNGNGIADATDISAGTSQDCNANTIPDECDIAAALAAANTAGNPHLQIDLDGGPIGNRTAGAAFFGTNCFGCHAPDGTGGTGPNIRNKTRTQIRQRLYLEVFHPGGGFPGTTAQDHADIEYFLADGGSKGRPDRIIDSCQTGLPDCDTDSVPDGRELQLQIQRDWNYNGLPDSCECIADFNGQGGLSVQDIFDFLAAYFSNDPRADFNAAGGITVQDIFDFLEFYFTGCA